MKFHNRKELKDRRIKLRDNPTPEEAQLWLYLEKKKLGYKFRRQHSIGKFRVDFYCSEKRLIIELDGNQHLVSDAVVYDNERTFFLESLNNRVIRFSNEEISKNIQKVIEKIKSTLYSI